MRSIRSRICVGWFVPVLLAIAGGASAWDGTGHQIVTQLAIEAMPSSVPGWLREPDVRERLAYLSIEPDRWRGQDADVLDHVNSPDHYFDIEELAEFQMKFAELPPFRNAFIERLTEYRVAQKVARPSGRDRSHTRTVPGMLPYAIAELRWKTAASITTWRSYSEYRDVATPTELRTSRDNVIHHMGLLSHFVGDAAQPLHTTMHHNGWVGPNPRGYTTSRRFHYVIDGDVFDMNAITFETLRSRARPPRRFDADREWAQTLAFIEAAHAKVERLYELDKTGGLNGPAGKQFIEDCVLDAGANLAGLWVAAFESSKIDDYRARELAARRRSAPDQASTSQPAAAAELPSSP